MKLGGWGGGDIPLILRISPVWRIEDSHAGTLSMLTLRIMILSMLTLGITILRTNRLTTMMLSIRALSIRTFSIRTFSIRTFSIRTLSMMISDLCRYAEWRQPECLISDAVY